MRKFERLDEPGLLKDNWERWGHEYEAERIAGNKGAFKWRDNIYKQLLTALLQQTDEHCSYCDNAELKLGDFTIDHFKPKSNPLFYSIAYKWDNLYFCCWHCQKAKGSQHSDYLLKPDAYDFSFSRYFTYNYSSNEIEVNPIASNEDQQKAIETIKVFDLNHAGLKKARRTSLMAYRRESMSLTPFFQDYNFRFLFDNFA